MVYYKNLEIDETKLNIGEKYTLFKVSEFMANTIKLEITITGFKKVENYAQYKNLLLIIFKQRGKRKEEGFYLKESDLYLKGWDLGIIADTDTEKGFKGNALINLVIDDIIGAEEDLKEKINKSYVFGNKAIVVYSLSKDILGKEQILFKELAEEQRQEHAVLNRLL